MPTAAPRRCSERAPRSASLPRRTGTSSDERGQHDRRRTRRRASRGWARCRTSPSLRRTMPGTPMPIPSSGACRRRPRHDVPDQRRPRTRPTCQASGSLRDRRLRRAPRPGRPARPGRPRRGRRRGRRRRRTAPPRSSGPRPTGGPRRAGPAAGAACSVSAERLELGDQAGDRAAVEPHQAGQLRAGELPGAVHVPQQGPEVVAADGFLVGAGARRAGAWPRLDARCGTAPPGDRVDARRQQQHAAGHEEVDVARLVEQARARWGSSRSPGRR